MLASIKPVNDPDFAMQFIGRVMRVSRAIREAFPRPVPIPPELDTAYVYLANAQEQSGFESAVRASINVKSQLEGQTERLETRQMQSGAVMYTSRVTEQLPVSYGLPEPQRMQYQIQESSAPGSGLSGPQGSLFGDAYSTDWAIQNGARLDEPLPLPLTARRNLTIPANEAELSELLILNAVRSYPRKTGIAHLPPAFSREQRPLMDDMSRVSESVAERLLVSDELMRSAASAALSLLQEKEIHTELTLGARHELDVQVITDRNALAREAIACLRKFKQVEAADMRIIVNRLALRLLASVMAASARLDDAQKFTDSEYQRLARDAAFWVIRREEAQLKELIQSLVAEQTIVEAAAPLPDAMLFPAEILLEGSRKNIFRVLPPSDDDLLQIERVLQTAQREWLKDREFVFNAQVWRIVGFNGLSKLNSEERDFARALDRAEFVEWWHRNPDRQSYSVRLVRADHIHYFHPDFVVCLKLDDDAVPATRLIETKHDVKDASRKARRIPKVYGKVLFLTKDAQRLRIVNDDGSLGAEVDSDTLEEMRAWLRDSSFTTGL